MKRDSLLLLVSWFQWQDTLLALYEYLAFFEDRVSNLKLILLLVSPERLFSKSSWRAERVWFLLPLKSGYRSPYNIASLCWWELGQSKVSGLETIGLRVCKWVYSLCFCLTTCKEKCSLNVLYTNTYWTSRAIFDTSVIKTVRVVFCKHLKTYLAKLGVSTNWWPWKYLLAQSKS